MSLSIGIHKTQQYHLTSPSLCHH